MSVHHPGDDGLAVHVEHTRSCSGKSSRFGIGADEDDSSGADGERRRHRSGVVDSVDPGVDYDEVGARSRRSLRGRSGVSTHRRSNQSDPRDESRNITSRKRSKGDGHSRFCFRAATAARAETQRAQQVIANFTGMIAAMTIVRRLAAVAVAGAAGCIPFPASSRAPTEVWLVLAPTAQVRANAGESADSSITRRGESHEAVLDTWIV